ncbi:chaperonin 10-like protein [Myxozyma melibiosi]|uniref:Chaperonin 10-like protein n=1 Tax=Myxozyma melibiosi TaxID=54550 RepID=A0ABR1FE68_9ASCO
MSMKEVIVDPDLEKTKIVESPIPSPGPHEVLIKVVVSGSNPKDWKFPVYSNTPMNSGDDIAGVVEKLGSEVHGLHVGDRVAAFHEMGKPHGSFAEYAIAYDYCTFLIPDSLSFEAAATLPLATLTGAYGLFDILGLPTPWRPATEEIPLIIYGASTSVGYFSIQLAKLAGIHPIIGVAGKSKQVALDAGCDFVVDYTATDDIPAAIRSYLKPGQKLTYAWDCISEKGSTEAVVAALEPGMGSKIAHILPEAFEPEKLAKFGVDIKVESVGAAHSEDPARRDFAWVFYQQLSKWLFEGRYKTHSYVAVEGGLASVSKGLADLMAHKVSGHKNVYRIADTPGL